MTSLKPARSALWMTSDAAVVSALVVVRLGVGSMGGVAGMIAVAIVGGSVVDALFLLWLSTLRDVTKLG